MTPKILKKKFPNESEKRMDKKTHHIGINYIFAYKICYHIRRKEANND